MSGACETRKASAMVAGETWDMSTSMPSRFISLTTRSPNGERPSCLGVSVAASAQSRVVLWVKRHVARSQDVEGAELRQAVLDRHAALDPDQRRDLARAGDALDVIGGVRHLERVGIALGHPADQVDLLGDGPRRDRVLAGDIDRPELRLHAPLAEPGDVGLAGVEPSRQVELGQCEVSLGAEPPREVVVAVEEHPGGMDLLRPLGHRRQAILVIVRTGTGPLPRGEGQDGGQTALDPTDAAHPRHEDTTRSHGGALPDSSKSPT